MGMSVTWICSLGTGQTSYLGLGSVWTRPESIFIPINTGLVKVAKVVLVLPEFLVDEVIETGKYLKGGQTTRGKMMLVRFLWIMNYRIYLERRSGGLKASGALV